MKTAFAVAALAGIASVAAAQTVSLTASATSITEGDDYVITVEASIPDGFEAIAGFLAIADFDAGLTQAAHDDFAHGRRVIDDQ